MTRFSNDLRVSGYNQQFREKVIQSAITGFTRQCQCEAADDGGTLLHRPGNYERAEKQKKKIPATEGSWLINAGET